MRLRLTPRDTTYFDLFTALAGHIVSGVGLLSEVLGAGKAERKAIAEKFRQVENDADDAAHAIQRQLAQSFVTPFDRDDIYGLTGALDDVVDAMEEACDLIVLYKVEALPTRVSEVVQVLQRCAELTQEAMPRLRTMDELSEYWREIHRLENQADRLHRKLVSELFDTVTDAILLIKLKEIVDILEDACDAFEKVAIMIETIALKES